MTKLPKGLQGASQSLSCLPEDVLECFAHLRSYCIPSPWSFSSSGFKNTGLPPACSSLLEHLCLEQSQAPGLPTLNWQHCLRPLLLTPPSQHWEGGLRVPPLPSLSCPRGSEGAGGRNSRGLSYPDQTCPSNPYAL